MSFGEEEEGIRARIHVHAHYGQQPGQSLKDLGRLAEAEAMYMWALVGKEKV